MFMYLFSMETRGLMCALVLMTGFGDTMQAKHRLPPNIDLVISKPVSLAALRAMLPTPVVVN